MGRMYHVEDMEEIVRLKAEIEEQRIQIVCRDSEINLLKGSVNSQKWKIGELRKEKQRLEAVAEAAVEIPKSEFGDDQRRGRFFCYECRGDLSTDEEGEVIYKWQDHEDDCKFRVLIKRLEEAGYRAALNGGGSDE